MSSFISLINLLMFIQKVMFQIHWIFLSVRSTWTHKSGLHIYLSFPVRFATFGVLAVTEGVKVVNSSELDDDVFEDVVKDPSHGLLTIKYDTGLYQLHL